MANSVKDLEETMKTWAWSAYKKTTNGSHFAYENAQMDVIWDKVHFVSGQPTFSNTSLSDNIQSQILFSSIFDNETNQFQHHNFQTTRTTMATTTTKLTKGFTRGVNTGIKLPVPDQVLKVTAGFGNYISIDCEDENTVEHALEWSVNTTVKAPKKRRTIAELEIAEQQFECSFSINVSMRGRVMVKISDPVSGRMLMVVQNDIATVIRDQFRVQNNGTNTITWPVGGTAKFKFGVSQRVRVRQEQIPPATADYGDDDDEDDYGDQYDQYGQHYYYQ